jgi:hypothetical protein
VPVPYFLLFLCLRKVTQEIFSELDETKAEVPIFPDTRLGVEIKLETRELNEYSKTQLNDAW